MTFIIWRQYTKDNSGIQALSKGLPSTYINTYIRIYYPVIRIVKCPVDLIKYELTGIVAVGVNPKAPN